MHTKRATAIADYTVAYPNALRLRRGERVIVEPRPTEWAGWIWCVRTDGLAGWAPRQVFATDTGEAFALEDYDARELGVKKGDQVSSLRELNGWHWCVDVAGGEGWLPAEVLHIVEPVTAPKLDHRFATDADLDQLAEWNLQLIRDEGHRNSMTLAELRARMHAWLISGEYRATIFSLAGGHEPVAYSLFRETADEIYLRQFFVDRERRRAGIGRAAMQILFERIWAANKRLTVEVLCANEPAIHFWRAMGYRDYCLSMERNA